MACYSVNKVNMLMWEKETKGIVKEAWCGISDRVAKAKAKGIEEKTDVGVALSMFRKLKKKKRSIGIDLLEILKSVSEVPKIPSVFVKG